MKKQKKTKINEKEAKTDIVVHRRHKKTVNKTRGDNVAFLEALLDVSKQS